MLFVVYDYFVTRIAFFQNRRRFVFKVFCVFFYKKATHITKTVPFLSLQAVYDQVIFIIPLSGVIVSEGHMRHVNDNRG